MDCIARIPRFFISSSMCILCCMVTAEPHSYSSEGEDYRWMTGFYFRCCIHTHPGHEVPGNSCDHSFSDIDASLHHALDNVAAFLQCEGGSFKRATSLYGENEEPVYCSDGQFQNLPIEDYTYVVPSAGDSGIRRWITRKTFGKISSAHNSPHTPYELLKTQEYGARYYPVTTFSDLRNDFIEGKLKLKQHEEFVFNFLSLENITREDSMTLVRSASHGMASTSIIETAFNQFAKGAKLAQISSSADKSDDLVQASIAAWDSWDEQSLARNRFHDLLQRYHFKHHPCHDQQKKSGEIDRLTSIAAAVYAEDAMPTIVQTLRDRGFT